ncbi:MAG: D-alanyl-D-alanine carboxypeptidase/D-alanyl-D-alanine-endopeptidase [Bacteroidetes bacterium]|nr:D-alanyl-D-alanine carboxypeptidase/D-alanyl-D-alanine-endopeptidase [Bacteroidota bacterium]
MKRCEKRRSTIFGINQQMPAGLGMRRFFLLLAAVLTWPAATISAQSADPVREMIRQSHASDSFWSVMVRSDDGEILYDLNGERLVRPASNLKLVTSAAFLEMIGEDHRFETTLFGAGDINGRRWDGDLHIEGGGDPTINGEAYSDPLFLFERWYTVLDSLGIEEVDGNIVGHDGLFDDRPYPRGWEWDDLSYYYAPEISALSFNFNVVDLEVRADGQPGATPSVTWFPFETPYVQFINEQTITPQGTAFDESYRRELGSNRIYLRSTLPRGHYETEPLSVHNPTLYFIDTFKQYLQRRGIAVNGQLLTTNEPVSGRAPGAVKLHTHRSAPLHTMIEWMNRESDNFYAEMLLKYTAAKRYNIPGSTEIGLEAVKEYMSSSGFDTTAVTLRDASGMAPATLLKAGDLNRFLVDVRSASYFDSFFRSLSTGGENGTLQYRFRNTPLRGNFRGKTGFLSGVRTLSGYLTTKKEETLVVTIFTNNYAIKTAVVDRIHDRILTYFYNSY